MATTIDLRLISYHPAQARIVRESRRFNMLACGRRFGKTVLLGDRLLDPALDGYPVGWFSPSYKMLADAWREMKRLLAPITREKSETEHRIALLTGGVVDFWSLDQADAGRGRRYKRVAVDEAGLMRNLEEAWQASIRPTLTDFAGDAWFAGTPKGRNFFWQLFERAGADPEFARWQMPTAANPHIPAEEIDAARNELPERIFQQEYEARFLEDGAGVFRRVRERATAEAQVEPVKEHRYAFGVDWGKMEDFTVIQVLDLTLRHQIYQDRFNRIDYAYQLGRLRALYDRFQPSIIVAERNSMGEPLVEQLQRDGLPVQPFLTTNATKAEAVESLALGFERGDIAILDDPVLIGELEAYEMDRLPSGLVRYNAPPGQHDDCVIALALAYQAIGQQVRYADGLY